MVNESRSLGSKLGAGLRPFRTAVLRGLGVVAPPLLTLVILLWMIRTVNYYIVEPVIDSTRDLLAKAVADIQTNLPDAQPTTDPTVVVSGGRTYKLLESGQYIPLSVYDGVVKHNPDERPPRGGQAAYRQWVELTYLRPWFVGPVVGDV